MKKFIWFSGIFLFVVVVVCIYFLNAVLPTGAGYTAKYICSQVFLAQRDPAVVFEKDVKHVSRERVRGCAPICNRDN